MQSFSTILGMATSTPAGLCSCTLCPRLKLLVASQTPCLSQKRKWKVKGKKACILLITPLQGCLPGHRKFKWQRKTHHNTHPSPGYVQGGIGQHNQLVAAVSLPCQASLLRATHQATYHPSHTLAMPLQACLAGGLYMPNSCWFTFTCIVTCGRLCGEYCAVGTGVDSR